MRTAEDRHRKVDIMTTNDYGPLARIDYPLVEEDSDMPPLTVEAVRSEVRSGLEQIRDYITTDLFVGMLEELYTRRPSERDAFVRTELLDESRLQERGITPPEGIKIQRSQFGDGRPTVFCVTKVMSDGIRKVTYTFDNDLALTTA